MTSLTYDYQPTPRQKLAHDLYADATLYGGAAGGGKSRFVRATAFAFAMQVPGSAVVIFRRTFPDLNRPGGMIPMLQMELAPFVKAGMAAYNKSDHMWRFQNGSVIELAYLNRDEDVARYQGSEYQMIVMDEATQMTWFQFDYMRSRLRASGAIKTRMKELGLRPRVILTANPGGIGHAWVKDYFIDPAPPETVWKPAPSEEDPDPGTRVFIPAKVTDNEHVDDDYIRQLNRMSEDTRRALRDGDWDVYSGQMFKAFRRSVHVIDPEEFGLSDVIDAPKAVGVDYGMSAPFCALWGALLPNGIVYVYREAYKAELTPEQQADMILNLEAPNERRQEWPVPVVLDSACWARDPRQLRKQPQMIVDGHKDTPPEGSIAWAYYERFGAGLEKSVKDRLSSVGLVQDRLEVRGDGFPRLLISSQCRNLIRTLPALPRDDRNPEQVDTASEDHAFDSLSYLLQHFARRTGEAITTQERIRRGRGLRLSAYGTVQSQTGDIAGGVGPMEW